MHTKQTPEERFWIKVNMNGGIPEGQPELGSCWLWTGARSRDDYGVFFVRRINNTLRLVKAHRFSWELKNGAIPTGLQILHKCDVRLCIRPDHLMTGTPNQNNEDKERKGRGNHAQGVQNGRSKLKPEQVIEIRQIHSQGKMGYDRIGKLYGISDTAVRDIIRRKNWGHLPDSFVSVKPQEKGISKQSTAYGENQHLAKLSEDSVRAIRILYHSKQFSYHQLGTMFGVQFSTIFGIVKRRTWRHVV